jgi:type IV pilus assembly protein PilM
MPNFDRIRDLVLQRLRPHVRASRGSDQPAVGIDLGSRFVRIAVVEAGPGLPVVRRLIAQPLAPTLVGADRVHDLEGTAAEIASVAAEAGVSGGRATIHVPGGSVTMKHHKVLRGGRDEVLAQAIRDVKTVNPLQHQLDMHVLEDRDSSAQMSILLAGAQRETVRDRQRVVAEAGLRVHAVDADFFALYNAFEFCHPDLLTQPAALIHIGYDSIIMIVTEGRAPKVARQLRLTLGQLEDRVRAEGKLSPGTDIGQVLRSRDFGQVYAVPFKDWLRELVDQIVLTLRAAGHAKTWKGRLFISGDGAMVPAIESTLREVTGMPFQIFNPLAKLTCTDRSIPEDGTAGAAFVLALGLALRQMEG